MSSNFYSDDFLKLAERSVALGEAQVGILRGMGGILGFMALETARIRANTSELAQIQRAMLQREVIQDKLEELIYQYQKMLKSFTDPRSKVPIFTRTVCIRHLLVLVKHGFLSTAIIRGRDNKAAFDECVEKSTALYRQLMKHPEGQKAVAWAQEETKRLQEEEARRRAEEERRRREEEEDQVTLIIRRVPSSTGPMYPVSVAVDGDPIGMLNEDEYLTITFPSGRHTIYLEGGGLSRTSEIYFGSGKEVSYQTYFSNFGILGGGLVLKPDE